MPSKEVDTAALFVAGPMVDDTDFKTREAPAYNAAGADVSLYEETQAGVTQTALTLTTAGAQDWVALSTDGYATCEITAAQLDNAGTAWIGGVFTGVLPFESLHYDIVDPSDAAILSLFLATLSSGKLVDASFGDMTDAIPADGSIGTMPQAVRMTRQFLYERVVSGTDVSVKKENGSTELAGALLDSATAPTSITRDA